LSTPDARTSIRPPAQPLDQARILSFFVPLAVSWLFMSLEGPITSGFISRRPGEENGLAGIGLLMAIAIFIESPVIDLLSTSTTLAKTHAAYLELRKFTGMLMVWTAAIHALITLSPFYWVLVEKWIGAPHEVAIVLRPAMAIMIPWASFVGWRRFHHGILIRFSNTRPVGLGTTVRVASVFLIGSLLYFFTDLPGLTLAACALVGSVIAETTFIHFATQPTIREELDPMIGKEEDKGLTMKRLWVFHYPLSLGTMTQISGMPLVSAALARSPDGKLNLAAWGLAMSVVFLFRSITFALPETVIALYKDDQTRVELGRFCARVGLACAAAIVVMYVSGGAHYLFGEVLDSKPEVAARATFALLVSVLVPMINARASFIRGLLTAHHRTGSRLVAILAAVSALLLALVAGVILRADGLVVIGVAMSLQVAAELVVLSLFWSRTMHNAGVPA
jgi:hypothetical protein